MDRFHFYQGYFGDEETTSLCTVTGMGIFVEADALESAAGMAKALGCHISVTDDSATWCAIFNRKGEQVFYGTDPNC